MARIKTYASDLEITGQERVIGTDVNDDTLNYTIDDIAAYIGGTVSGITQNNFIREIYTTRATGDTLAEAATAVNETAGFTVNDTDIVVFRVSRNQEIVQITDRPDERLFYDYYMLKDRGKGDYGLGGTITITSAHLIFLRTTEVYSITSPTGTVPVVYQLTTPDIDEAVEFTLNNFSNGTGFTVVSGTDYYFEVLETVGTSRLSTDVPQYTGNYALYRFVGAAGNYGLDGVDIAVSTDFELVQLNDSDKDNGIPVRKIVVGAVIGSGAITNIAEAVNNSFRGLINANPQEILIFEVNRSVTTSVAEPSIPTTVNIFLEKYIWTRGAAQSINVGSTVSDYELIFERDITGSVPTTVDANATVHAVSNSDTDAPQDAVNNSPNTFIVDGSSDVLFIVYNTDVKVPTYTIWQFTGANGTYGFGGTATVLGDFTEITQISTSDSKIYKTSQLKNDGEDGTAPYITSATPPTGLETLDEGNGVGHRIVGRNPANFGNIGEHAFDFSRSTGASSTRGSTATVATTFGQDNENNGAGTFVNGFECQVGQDGGTVLGYNFVNGYYHTVNNWSFDMTVLGEGNTAGTAGSVGGSSEWVAYQGIVSGLDNDVYASRSTHAFGANLLMGSGGCTVVGISNIDNTVTFATQLQSTLDVAGNPVFVIGNGDYNTVSKTGTRSNAMEVLLNGNITFDSLTTGMIDSAGAQSAVTKGWVQAQPVNLEGYNFTGTEGGGDLVLTLGNPVSNARWIVDDVTDTIKTGFISAGFTGLTFSSSSAIYGNANTSGKFTNPTGSYSITMQATSIGESGSNAADFSIAIGRAIVTTNQGVYSAGFGTLHTLNNSSAFAANFGNTADGQSSSVFGVNNTAGAFAEMVVGTHATISSVTSANSYNSADRAFVIGIGASTGSRADGFEVQRTGDVSFPSLTTALIDAAGDDSAVTKEWVEENKGSIENSVVISTAGVQGLNTTPVTVVSAPTTDTIEIPKTIVYKVDPVAAAFDNVTVSLRYVGGATIPNSTHNISSATDTAEVYIVDTNFTPSIATAIEVVASADSVIGDGELTVFVLSDRVNLGGFSGISDARLKKDIIVLSNVNGLDLVTWTWNDEAEKLGHSGQGFGVIAQQAQEIIPEAVVEGKDGYLRVRYDIISKFLNSVASEQVS